MLQSEYGLEEGGFSIMSIMLPRNVHLSIDCLFYGAALLKTAFVEFYVRWLRKMAGDLSPNCLDDIKNY